MKTLKQHIEEKLYHQQVDEKLVINKNSEFDDASYEQLDDIFSKVCKSKHCFIQDDVNLLKRINILDIVKKIFPKIFMQFEDTAIWSEYNNFIREYNQKGCLNSLENCNISKGVMYVNDEGWPIMNKAFDYTISDFLRENNKTKTIIMFNGECVSYTYEDKNFFMLAFYDNVHHNVDGFIGIKFN